MDQLRMWFDTYDADLARVRCFWNGEGRAMVSLTPSGHDYRQSFDDATILSEAPRFLEAQAKLPGLNLPSLYPDWGTISTPLMNDLAYGARGLQYFTYAHEQAMVRPDGSTTETWELAKHINTEIHQLAPVLQALRNVGTYRTEPLWSGTQHLHQSHLPPLLECEGDPVTVGVFVDESDALHLFIVNGSPVDWSSIRLKVNVDPGKQRLCVFDMLAEDGQGAFAELWPADPRDQLITLAPGEGRLFKISNTGMKARF